MSPKVHLLLPDYIVDWQNLRRLSLRDRGITKLFDNLGCLSSLESLDLAENSFESIPESIINLSRLKSLDISYCERLECLPKLPYGCVSLRAQNCTSLKVLAGVSSQNGIVSMDSKSRKKKFQVHFGNCLKLDAKEVEGFCQSFWQNVTREREVEESVDDWVYHRDDWVCYPGSEAPSGFDRRMGSFIKVELPLNLIYSSLLLCVVLAPIPNNDYKIPFWYEIKFDCSLKYKDKNLSMPTAIDWFAAFIANHVFLLTFHNDIFRNFFRECHQKSSPSEVIEASFGFAFNTVPIQFPVGFKIVQCGVHFISAHTTENFHESLIENETQQIEVHDNSLEEDEPHPSPFKVFNFFPEHPTNQVHDNCEKEAEAQLERLKMFNFFWEHPINQAFDSAIYSDDIHKLCYNEVSFELDLKDPYGKPMECGKVKKCGLRLMDAQDIAEPSASFSSNNEDDFWESTEKFCEDEFQKSIEKLCSGRFSSHDDDDFWESIEELN